MMMTKTQETIYASLKLFLKESKLLSFDLRLKFYGFKALEIEESIVPEGGFINICALKSSRLYKYPEPYLSELGFFKSVSYYNAESVPHAPVLYLNKARMRLFFFTQEQYDQVQDVENTLLLVSRNQSLSARERIVVASDLLKRGSSVPVAYMH